MPHVVTQPCCSDASCAYACPVNCIHPTPDEPDFLTAEMVYIDPASCVDCGACVSACPVDAIVPHTKLQESQERYLSINADFYKEDRPRRLLAPVIPAPAARRDIEPLRVAIIGSGPSAMYAADELLTQPGVQVNVFDRLPTPHGLVRAGVAPDHQKTKQVTRLFDTIADQRGFEYYLNVEVGTDISHDELLSHHHAVVYAVGASSDRRLGIPGEELSGCVSATDFVAWYNGHPDHAGATFDLSQRRVVIIGNGNVALDAARILTSDPAKLARTDIAAHALKALRESKIEEVVIVGRRGPAQSAFTVPEFSGLLAEPDIDIVVEGDIEADETALDHSTAQKIAMLREAQAGTPTPGRKRITLRYLAAPTQILGDDNVVGVEFARNSLTVSADGNVAITATGELDTLATGLVLTSIGYRGVPVAGLPFDDRAGVIPNEGGRVQNTPGTYAVGWIKRGPSGFIGTNKSCAQETVNALVDDYNAGLLNAPKYAAAQLPRTIRALQPATVDRAGWNAIDRVELERGVAQNRVRDKITDRASFAAVVASVPRPRLPKRLAAAVAARI
ncbi:FAD-dependent oxidoreductase [Antrihabitans sp. YC2-6]|uniref:FAD-dependent oxidoreductase n=1 Tax=Antrihabitans sp. YC2-6 TaxID=2799498 RepID=UPI0018F76086|nr:FAD-dependent oxidoreductase [Antrihabitans sp. YC2-6]MBJ8347980.1 FAD-dependent oxidoreductase [Antrihabitans sp. YC2-6]